MIVYLKSCIFLGYYIYMLLILDKIIALPSWQSV